MIGYYLRLIFVFVLVGGSTGASVFALLCACQYLGVI